MKSRVKVSNQTIEMTRMIHYIKQLYVHEMTIGDGVMQCEILWEDKVCKLSSIEVKNSGDRA